MGDRQPVSNAEEFEAAFAAYDKARLKAFKSNDDDDIEEFQERRKTLIDVIDYNRDLIARALRRDAAIEEPESHLEMLDAIAKAVKRSDDRGISWTILAEEAVVAFREVVK